MAAVETVERGTARVQDAHDIEQMYRRHGGAVYRRCLRFLGCPFEAEAAMQEVFLSMLGRIGGLKEPDKAANYLFRVTTNTCLKHLRKAVRRGCVEVPDRHLGPRSAVDGSADAGAGPEALVADLSLLRHCIGLASGRMQRAVCLHFLEEMSFEEIGEEMGISPQHVGRLVRMFRQRVSKERSRLEYGR
jgi:RNA polymerase sigma-70 factor, ECF subfamily